MQEVEYKNLGYGVIGISIPLGRANLVLIKAKKGYIMCGYLNITTAESLGDAACVVRGVKHVEDALGAEIKELTSAARALGIKKGMKVREALKLLK